ncbi:Aorsin [Lachnellula willkommii]|uniref:tripeptidyl-peptidase II n=1 Tax=Lachnellula willkommii TaxID=215461 RepID=A0A559MM65_9HELO|nr:Aorsin [Lachnellula willkommii]
MANMRFYLLTITVLLGWVEALAVPAHVEVHERRQSLSPRWSKRDRVESHKVLQMRVGLAQTNLDNGYEHLMDVSNPASPNFGKHWSSERVINTFRPSKQTEDEVKEWLVKSGIPAKRITHSDNKGWFAFFATTEEAEKLLHTTYHEYEDSVTGGVMPACEEYHIPQNIRKHIDYVTPGIKLLAPVESHASKKRDAALASKGLAKRNLHGVLKVENPPYTDPNDLDTCDVAITPACVAALYKIPPSISCHPDNSIGIFESELQFYTQQDLDLFFDNYTQYIPQGTHPVPANIDGGQQSTEDPYEAGGEANLDIQLAYPIVYPQTITLYQVDDFIVQANQNDTYTFGFNTFLDALDGSYCSFSAYNETGNDPTLDQAYPDPEIGGWSGNLMCGTYKPTNVISLSYGGQESDLPITYQKRQCLEYMKLGLQGVSFLFASGDSGVSNIKELELTRVDYPSSAGGIDGPTGCLGPNLDIFNPTWPGTCPYVTSVGATKVYPGSKVTDAHPESAVYDPAGHPYSVNYSSGGGFSNIYPIPEYQARFVKDFFDNHNPPYTSYSALSPDLNVTGALPDIGALAGTSGGIYNRIGRGIPDVSANGDNIAMYNGGNFSLSGGTSASTPIFSAVVTRINEERLSVGKGPIGFLNPSLYANPGMLNDIINGTNPGCGTVGFSAVEGWDPVSGLGTPNFPKMKEYYLSLP